MMTYAKTLEFDGAMHEIHSKQVKAWEARHKDLIKKQGKKCTKKGAK